MPAQSEKRHYDSRLQRSTVKLYADSVTTDFPSLFAFPRYLLFAVDFFFVFFSLCLSLHEFSHSLIWLWFAIFL